MTGSRIHYVVNVEAAIYRDGEYLMARRSEAEDHAAGAWSLVGGKVEDVTSADNVLERTVEREVREEVGVELGETAYVESSAFVADGGNHVVNVVFLGRHEEGAPTVREPEEVDALEWLTPEAIRDSEDVPPFTRDYVDAADRKRERLGW